MRMAGDTQIHRHNSGDLVGGLTSDPGHERVHVRRIRPVAVRSDCVLMPATVRRGRRRKREAEKAERPLK